MVDFPPMHAYSPDLAAIAIRSLLRPLTPTPPDGVEARWDVRPPIRAVIWDVYGTLLQSASGEIGAASEGGLSGAITDVLAESAPGGAPGDPQEARLALQAEQLASGFRDAVERQQQRATDAGALRGEIDVRTVWQELLTEVLPTPQTDPLMFALQVELRHNPTWPMPGADDVLLTLHRRGYTQGIVSNAQFFTPLILQQQLGLGLGELGISAPMRVWSYEHGVAKPEPALFQKMVSGLDASGISPAQTLYVGNDMLNDIAGANRAGMQTALFAGDSRSYRPRTGNQRARDIRPDAVLLSLISLLELLP